MRSLGPRLEIAVSLTILMVGAAVVAAMHLTWPEPQLPAMAYSVSSGDSGLAAKLKPFEINDISGAAVELRPGSEGHRLVRLSNPNSVDIIVTQLNAVPGQPVDEAQNRVTDCPAGVLTVESINNPLLIGHGGSVEVKMIVRIAKDIPAACLDAVFPLTYSGQATHG